MRGHRTRRADGRRSGATPSRRLEATQTITVTVNASARPQPARGGARGALRLDRGRGLDEPQELVGGRPRWASSTGCRPTPPAGSRSWFFVTTAWSAQSRPSWGASRSCGTALTEAYSAVGRAAPRWIDPAPVAGDYPDSGGAPDGARAWRWSEKDLDFRAPRPRFSSPSPDPLGNPRLSHSPLYGTASPHRPGS